MKSFCTCGLFLAATTWWAAGYAEAQQAAAYRSPSLLPIPTAYSGYSQPRSPAYQQGTAAWSTYTADVSVKVQPGEPELYDPAPVPPNGPQQYRGQAQPYNGSQQAYPPVHVDHFDVGPSVAVGDCAGGDLAGCGGRTLCSQWFGTVGGVIMTRDHANDLWLSFDTAAINSRVLTSRDADMNWGGGVEARVGRYFDCGRVGLEGLYWGVYADEEEANAFGANMAGNLNTTFAFDSLEYDDGLGGGAAAVVDWYDGALRHRLRRDYDFHNVEINLFGQPDCLAYGNCCGPNLRLGWLVGVRYFNFDEDFEFASDETNTTFGDDPVSELLYQIETENHLVGVQLGGRADYMLTPCLTFYSGTKLGLYGNHMRHRQFVGAGNGAAVINNGLSAFNGRQFDIASHENDVAFLGELDLGVDYRLGDCWSIASGYRAVAVTGVALTDNQVPQFFDDLADVDDIDANGSLILHGAYVRAEFNY